MTSKVDRFLARQTAWQAELAALRAILLDCGLTEDFKWGKPTYTHQGGNMVQIAGLKACCWLMFFKGALLDDPDGVLTMAGPNSQSMRVVPYTSVAAIAAAEPMIRAYVAEAMAAEEAGLKVDFSPGRVLEYPQELIDAFDADPDLRTAFEALTPGRQRGFNLHFTGAKQSATRVNRIARAVPLIMAGKGLNDR